MIKFLPVKDAPADTKMPTRKTTDSAGYDFYLPCDVVIKPYGCTKIIPTNVKAIMPKDFVLLIFIRSSIGIKRKVTLPNSVAVIDSDFANCEENDGNIGIVLQNNSYKWQRFKKGDRVAQGIFIPWNKTVDDNTKIVRQGGVGSTK